jgi:hypothetical protein
VRLPGARDERAWHAFCIGDGERARAGPTLSVVRALDQPRTVLLLGMMAKWLRKDAMSPQHARWLFALLLRVDRLLTADATSALRTLCRRCAALRAAMTPADDAALVASLNMVVTIVGLYFGQRDLLS